MREKGLGFSVALVKLDYEANGFIIKYNVHCGPGRTFNKDKHVKLVRKTVVDSIDV